jgi:hypothetical protein
VINYSFSSTVDGSTFASVPVGETFTISFTVDTAIPPTSWFQNGSFTLADFNSSIGSMTMTAGSYAATGTQTLLRQINAPFSDQYRADASVDPGLAPLEGLDLVYFAFEAFDPTGKVISDALTPLEDPLLEGFAYYSFWAVFASPGPESKYIHGLVVFPTVPEPGTSALLGIGLALCLVGRGFGRRSICRGSFVLNGFRPEHQAVTETLRRAREHGV